MSEKKRKILTGAQKAKIAMEAVNGHKTANEIPQEHGVHPTQIGQSNMELSWLRKVAGSRYFCEIFFRASC